MSADYLARRDIIRAAAAMALGSFMAPWRGAAAMSAGNFKDNPFSLGVASGDPRPDGMVLWTRLAPSPLDPGPAGEFAELSQQPAILGK